MTELKTVEELQKLKDKPKTSVSAEVYGKYNLKSAFTPKLV